MAALTTCDRRDWLHAWPVLAYGLRDFAKMAVPHSLPLSGIWKRGNRSGAPLPEALCVLPVRTALRRRLIGARDLMIEGARTNAVQSRQRRIRMAPLKSEPKSESEVGNVVFPLTDVVQHP